jgi:5-aminopentanamidase
MSDTRVSNTRVSNTRVSNTVRVAAWQCQPGPLDVAGNLRRLDEICATAAARQVEVLVTPEMFISGYGLAADQVSRLAEAAGGPTEAAVAEIARRRGLAIVYGHPERVAAGHTAENPGLDDRSPEKRSPEKRSPENRPYNAATLIGPDGVVRGRHRKVHLFGDVDRSLFAPSPAPPTAFDFNGSRVGLLICYDVEFPEAVRRLAVDGARTVLVPTANMTGYDHVQQLLVPARACENGCGIVYANYCGADDIFEYNGLSMICGPHGEVLAQATAKDEELIVADLPTESAGTYLADRRADLYDG